MACDRVDVGCVSVSVNVSGGDESYLYLQLSLWLLLTQVLRGLSLRGTCDARDAEERAMFLSLSSLFDFLGMISGALGDNRMDAQPFRRLSRPPWPTDFARPLVFEYVYFSSITSPRREERFCSLSRDLLL